MKLPFKRPGSATFVVSAFVLLLASRGAISASEAATTPVETGLALSAIDFPLFEDQDLSVADLRLVMAALGDESDPAVSHSATPEADAPKADDASKLRITEYVVRAGDSFGSIGARHGVSAATVMAFNDLTPRGLRAGSTIKVPSLNGIQVRLEKGETLSDLARAYGVKLSEVVDVNRITDPRAVQANQKLFLPGAKARLARREGPEKALFPVARGFISSKYGMRIHPISGDRRYHAGIDIAAPQGTPIRAIKSGKVIFSGRRGGYGNVVDVRHDDGTISRYAHTQINLVKRGQRVSQGQTIARVGSTGHSTGPHLHLEIIRNGQRKNPSAYM